MIGEWPPLRNVLRCSAMAVAIGLSLGSLTLISPALPRVVALTGVAVALFLTLPLRPILLLYSLIVVIPFTSALPRGIIVSFLTPNELVLLLTTAFAALYLSVGGSRRRIPHTVTFATVVFVLGTSIIPLFAYYLRNIAVTPQDVLSLIAPLQYVLLLYLYSALLRGEHERRLAVQLMVASSSAVALVGLLQIAGVDVVETLLQRFYPSVQTETSALYGRATSVMGAWNALGLFLVTNLLIIAAVYPNETKRTYRLNMQVATVLSILCLLATNLYSGILGLMVGYVFIKTRDRRNFRAILPLSVVIAIGLYLLLPELTARFAYQARAGTWIPETLVYRWSVWKAIFLPRIAQHPVWGVRPSFDGLPFTSPESQYIYYLYRSGGVSLVSHAVWVATLAGWCIRALARSREFFWRSLVLLLLALLIVFSLIGLINPVFTYSGSIDYFWILLGIAINGYMSQVTSGASASEM